jgi:hypothetical protein
VNQPKVEPEGYIRFLVASPRQFTCTEAAAVQPSGPNPPAHDAFRRLLTRLEPDPLRLESWCYGHGFTWLEAKAEIIRVAVRA